MRAATPGVSSDVNACIGVYPLASAQIATGLFPQGQATPENIAAASPTSYIDKSFAPTIFIHGTNDGTVPAQSSIDFYTKLHALGVPTTLTLIQGADHAFDNNAPDAVELMAAVDRSLPRPAAGQSETLSVVWRRRRPRAWGTRRSRLRAAEDNSSISSGASGAPSHILSRLPDTGAPPVCRRRMDSDCLARASRAASG